MVFQDADGCKQQALPNSGNSGGRLGGRTFLDIYIHIQNKKYIYILKKKKSTKKTQLDNICQDKH